LSGPHTHALYAHGHSPVHLAPSQVKVVALVAFVVGVVATPREAIWAFGIHLFLLLSVVSVAELPFSFVLRRMTIELPFVAFALFLPLVGSGPHVTLAGLSLSEPGLWGAWNIVAKGTLGVGMSVVLVATTEIPDLLAGLDRLRVPRVLTAIAGFMVRYLDVVLAEVGRTRTAMTARGADPRWFWQARPLASASGALFVRSFERGERVHRAMLARGYDGTMPDVGVSKASLKTWGVFLILPVTAWMVALLAVIG